VSGSVKVTVKPNTAERLRQIILKVTDDPIGRFPSQQPTMPWMAATGRVVGRDNPGRTLVKCRDYVTVAAAV
jgi:hypothetical protein